MEMMQLYEWMKPGKIMDTQYGEIRADEWMTLEADRITQNGDRIAEIKEEGGKIALFVDRVVEDG